jgi:signal transduction histidine kinase
MILMPKPQDLGWSRRGVFDFFYGVFIFLLISVLVLGSLAFMLLERRLYFEALSRTVISMALLLLVVAWAWNPRPGFSGVGVFFSQYLLTIGLPFDTWLRQLMECAERDGEPDRFLQDVGEQLLLDLPWVVGGKWSPADGMEAGEGGFGKQSAYPQEFLHRPLLLTIYARHPLSPVLVWHLQLLTRLACEYYLAKWRARALQQMSYLRAVHQTGARLTHEVKNLLQSLDNLCYLMETSVDADAMRLQQLLRRQLPQIAQRLRLTLAKLQPPLWEGDGGVAQRDEIVAKEWWEALQQRFPHSHIRYAPVAFDSGGRLPAGLFDSVVDNLLHNALIKLQSEDGIQIDVSISPDAGRLRVCDSGRALAEDLAARLFQAPVASENGFGIGLFNAATQADSLGYSLRLASNAHGDVCFELAKSDGSLLSQ